MPRFRGFRGSFESFDRIVSRATNDTSAALASAPLPKIEEGADTLTDESESEQERVIEEPGKDQEREEEEEDEEGDEDVGWYEKKRLQRIKENHIISKNILFNQAAISLL